MGGNVNSWDCGNLLPRNPEKIADVEISAVIGDPTLRQMAHSLRFQRFAAADPAPRRLSVVHTQQDLEPPWDKAELWLVPEATRGLDLEEHILLRRKPWIFFLLILLIF